MSEISAPPINTPAAPASEHPVAAPWGNEGVWNLGEGANAKPWYSTVPEEPVRQLMDQKKYANPAVLATAYYNLNKLQNGAGDVIALPPANATPEQIKVFNSKLGVPEAPEGYKFTAPDGQTLDPKMTTFAQNFLHKLGVPASRADTALTEWNAYVAAQTQEAEAQREQANTAELAALQTRWGADLDANRAAGLRVLQSLNAPELVEKVERAIGTAPLVELLAMIGRKSSEASFTEGRGNGDPNDPANMTREQVAVRIAQLRGDPTFDAKYTDAKHPEHVAAVELMNRLYAKA